jgi:hypothetical protein
MTEWVSLDLITDLPLTKKGHDAVVVFIDRLSKMVHVAACTKTVTAERLAELFEQEVFKHHGIPKGIVSDRDVRSQSDFWKSFNGKLGIKLNMSTAKHPLTDGQTARANGILEDTLRHFVGPYQTDWDEYLAVAEFAINNAWSQSTQTTPFMLSYGQHPDTPVTLQLGSHNPTVNKSTSLSVSGVPSLRKPSFVSKLPSRDRRPRRIVDGAPHQNLRLEMRF